MKKILFSIIVFIASSNCLAETVTINKNSIQIGTQTIKKNSKFTIDRSLHLNEVVIGNAKDGEKRFFVVKKNERQILRTKAAIKESSAIDLELTPGNMYQFEWKESFKFNTIQGKPEEPTERADNVDKEVKNVADVETTTSDNELVDKVETEDSLGMVETSNVEGSKSDVNGYFVWNLILTILLVLLSIYTFLNNVKTKVALKARKKMIFDLQEQLDNFSPNASSTPVNMQKQLAGIKDNLKKELKNSLKNELTSDLRLSLTNELKNDLMNYLANDLMNNLTNNLTSDLKDALTSDLKDTFNSDYDRLSAEIDSLRQKINSMPVVQSQPAAAQPEKRESLQSEIAHNREQQQNNPLDSIQFGSLSRWIDARKPVRQDQPAAPGTPQQHSEPSVSETQVKRGWNMQDVDDDDTVAVNPATEHVAPALEPTIFQMNDDDNGNVAAEDAATPSQRLTGNTDNGASINWLDFKESDEGYFKLMGEDAKTGNAIFQAYQDFETDDCLFKARILDTNKAEFDLISLRRIQYLSYINGAVNSVGTCSLKDANTYGLISKGYAEKTPDGSWLITRKVEIEVSK